MDKNFFDKNALSVPEFSRSFAVERLEQGEVSESIAARPDECAALAARFGLVAIRSLRADLVLRRVGQGPVVRVEGRLHAEVVQNCVVSLEPIDNKIEERVLLNFAPERQVEARNDSPSKGHGKGRSPVVEDEPEVEGEDLPEPIVGGRIDLGEAVAQQLALALDPYPRKPGVRLEDVIVPKEGISLGAGLGTARQPFAALARLTRRKP